MSFPADRPICFTADHSQMVEETDPRAAFLAYAKGKFISPGDVEKYGLKHRDGRVILSDKSVAEAESKDVLEAAEKAADAPAEDDEAPAPEWPLSVSPEDYLARYGDDAKNSALARAVIEAAEG